MDTNRTISEEIRVLMTRDRMTQQGLANVLGLATQGAASKKLRGQSGPWSVDELELVANHFNVPITDLFTSSDLRKDASAWIDSTLVDAGV